MADDDNRDYVPQRAAEDAAPTLKERGLAAFRSRVGRIALPSVLVLAVSAGLAFNAVPGPADSDALEGVPAAPMVHVERTADDLSRSAEREPVIDPAATAEQENLPAVAVAQPAGQGAEQPAEPQVLGSAAFAPAVTKATEEQFATSALNIRSAATADSEKIGSFDRRDRVGVTGATDKGFSQIEFDGRNGWVASQHLSKSEPASAPAGGPSAGESGKAAPGGGAACKSPLSGLTSRTTAVHQLLCANFPAISSYGGVRPDWDDEHPSGRAIDAMVSSTSTGDAVANWARANAAKYGITEVIWNQRIWTAQRGSEGWRAMGDRGSVTANHGDHVHISVS